MKKIILLVLATLMMVGCNYTRTDHTTSDGKRVCIIDSCEYITYSNGYGQHYTDAAVIEGVEIAEIVA